LRQPQSDGGEIAESPGTAVAEGGPAEGLQRLGKAAQVLAGFGVDPADEGSAVNARTRVPMARSRSVSLTLANSTSMPRLPGFGQGGTPAQVAGHLVTTPGTGAAARRWRHLRAGDYRADTTLVRAVPGRAPGRLPQRERDLRRIAAPAGPAPLVRDI